MCEFCSGLGLSEHRDQYHLDFAGFYSADATDTAVKCVIADEDDDSRNENENGEDGT